MKPTIDDILDFVAHYAGKDGLNSNSDIEGELGVIKDDWHEMMGSFAKTFDVDMSTYLWYFHSSEEGFSIGALFFKPPYERVERVPITPNDLLRIAIQKKWDIEYPEHELPKRRYDSIIGTGLLLIGIALTLWYYLK